MDRKAFLRVGWRRLADAAISLTQVAASRVGGKLIRPPGVLDELDFLTHCTRCGDCVKACGPGSILVAGGRAGLNVGTPYLDPNGHRPCFVCDDLPCIAACEAGALVPMAIAQLRMGVALVDRERCFAWQGEACDACLRPCPLGSAAIFADPRTGKVYVDPDHCIGCGQCAYHCPTDPGSIRLVRLGSG